MANSFVEVTYTFLPGSSPIQALINSSATLCCRVKQAESDQIYEAMKAKGLPVEYLLYEDEGHGFARPPNSLDFCSRYTCFSLGQISRGC